MVNDSAPAVLLYREMNEVHIDKKKYDILLTPQFYTMKKEALPVKYLYQANKVAPAMFDGLLEGEHRYFVFRQDEHWVFVAYNPAEIIDFVKQKHLPIEKIGKVFFAEQVVSQMKTPIALGEHYALSPIEGAATIAPLSIFEESIPLDTSSIELPKRGVRLDVGTASPFSKKQMWILSAILFLFGSAWLAEGLRYGKGNGTVSEKIEKMYRDFPALQSQYTRESVANKYRQIDKSERQKRRMIKKIADILSTGATLRSLQIEKNRIEATLSLPKGKDIQSIKRLLPQSGLAVADASSGETVVIEGRL